MPEPLSPAVTMRKLPLGLLLGWVLIAGTAQAQVMRCVDAKTGQQFVLFYSVVLLERVQDDQKSTKSLV